MGAVIQVVGGGMLLPAVVALAISLACQRWLPPTAGQRTALPFGLAIGFFAGYVLLPEWAELVPSRQWHWLPYLAALAMIAAAIGCADGVWSGERWLLWGAMFLAAALVLVPDWPDLQPPRRYCVPLLATYCLGLTACVFPLVDRLPPKMLLAHLSIVAFALAAVTAAFVSLVYGQLAGVAAAATSGCCAAAFIRGKAFDVRSLVPVFFLLVGGSAFVGSIDPQPPLVGLMVVSAAPAALWVPVALRLNQQQRAVNLLVQCAALGCIILLGIGLVMLAEASAE